MICTHRRLRRRAASAAVFAATCLSVTPYVGALTTTWDGVTFNSDQSIAAGSNIAIYDGLTLNATLLLLDGYQGTLLTFNGTQTLTGTGTIVVNDGASAGIHRMNVTGGTLTIGPLITIETGTGSATVGNGADGSIINQGTLSAQTAGKYLQVNPGGTFTNQGTLLASNSSTLLVSNLTGNLGNASATAGGTLDVTGTFTNDQDRSVSAASRLVLRGNWTNAANIAVDSGSLGLYGTWNNAGSISAVNSDVTLGGTFTVGNLGTFTRSGGTVHIAGTLDNSNSTLSLDGGTGSWLLDGGTISNGTVTTSGGASLLLAQYAYSTLDHVALQTDLLIPGSTTLTVQNGLTLAGGHSVVFGDPTASSYPGDRIVNFQGGGTLGGSGVISFDNLSGGGGRGQIYSTGGTLTIGPSITVRATTGGGTVGNPSADLVNQGSIINLSYTNNGAILVTGTHVRNEGLIEVGYAAQVSLSGSWTNAGTLRVDDGGTLVLQGSFTPDSIGTVVHTNPAGGRVQLDGALDNTGHTTSLSQLLGPWELYGCHITGGTLTGPIPLHTPAATSVGILDAVALAGSLSIPSGTTLDVQNGLTLAAGGSLTLAPTSSSNTATLYLQGAQTLDGPGEIDFSSSIGSATGRILASAGPIVLGPSLLVRATGLGAHLINDTSLPLVNHGTISSLSTGASITLYGSTITNDGIIEGRDGGSVTLSPSWSNTGLLRAVNGGTVHLQGTFTPAVLGSFTGTTGEVIVDGGTLDNSDAAHPLTLSAASGPLYLANNGSVSGGAVVSADGTPLGAAAGTSTLDDVNLQTDARILNGAILQLANGTTAAGRTFSLQSTGTFTALKAAAGEALPANATVSFDTNSAYNVVTTLPGYSLVIPATDTIRTGAAGSGSVGVSSMGLTNSGAISAETAGQSITVAGANWTNQGTLQAKNGGTLSLGGTFTPNSIGTLVTDGSPVNISGSLNATVTPLTLSAALPLGLAAGSITGTVNSADGTRLPVRGLGSALSGATVNAAVAVLPGASLAVSSNTTLNAPVTVTGTGVLTLIGPWTNTSNISASGGGTISLGGTPPAAISNVSLTNATLRVTGNAYTTANLAPISFTSSTILVSGQGTLDNSNNTLSLSPATATLTVSGGTFKGGTISGPASTPVVFTASNSTGILNGVTLAADARIVPSSTLTVSSGITLSNAHVSLQGGSTASGTASFGFSGAQTLAGSGDISLDGTTGSNTVRAYSSTSALTIAPGITIHTGTQGGSVGSVIRAPLTLQGTISAQTAARTLTIIGSTVTNSGSLLATNGASLVIDATGFTNSGTITVGTSSTLRLANAAATAALGTVSLSGTALLDYTGTSPVDSIRQQLSGGSISTPLTGKTIGYAEAATLLGLAGSQTTTYANQTVDATTLILLPALAGDANLDGVVNADDYALLDRSFYRSIANPGWTGGDFNYDGTVNSADYLLIDQSYLAAHPAAAPMLLAERGVTFGEAYAVELAAAVPEPTSVGSGIAALLLLSGRGRRGTARGART